MIYWICILPNISIGIGPKNPVSVGSSGHAVDFGPHHLHWKLIWRGTFNSQHEQEEWLQWGKPLSVFIWAPDCCFKTDLKSFFGAKGKEVMINSSEQNSSVFIARNAKHCQNFDKVPLSVWQEARGVRIPTPGRPQRPGSTSQERGGGLLWHPCSGLGLTTRRQRSTGRFTSSEVRK